MKIEILECGYGPVWKRAKVDQRRDLLGSLSEKSSVHQTGVETEPLASFFFLKMRTSYDPDSVNHGVLHSVEIRSVQLVRDKKKNLHRDGQKARTIWR